jgi:hypothetical protein
MKEKRKNFEDEGEEIMNKRERMLVGLPYKAL